MTGFGAITSDRLSLARRRWQAAYAAEVDYSATDQYEQLGACLQALKRSSCCSANNPTRKSSTEQHLHTLSLAPRSMSAYADWGIPIMSNCDP
jgi:hypothetical protein